MTKYGVQPPSGVFASGLRCEVQAYAKTAGNIHRGMAQGYIVARRPNEPSESAFSVHTVETNDMGETWFASNGHYDMTIEEAFDLFRERVF